MTRRVAGAVAAALMLLTGAWLVLAPFALGIQPADKDWVDETFVDVWSGIGLAVVGLIGVVAFAAALYQHLTERGLVLPRVVARPAEPPAAPAAEPQPQQQPQSGGSGDLDALLAPLITALTEDIARERRAPNGATENLRRGARVAGEGGQRGRIYGAPEMRQDEGEDQSL